MTRRIFTTLLSGVAVLRHAAAALVTGAEKRDEDEWYLGPDWTQLPSGWRVHDGRTLFPLTNGAYGASESKPIGQVLVEEGRAKFSWSRPFRGRISVFGKGNRWEWVRDKRGEARRIALDVEVEGFFVCP